MVISDQMKDTMHKETINFIMKANTRFSGLGRRSFRINYNITQHKPGSSEIGKFPGFYLRERQDVGGPAYPSERRVQLKHFLIAYE